MELMGNMRRTHYSTRVTEEMVGQEVVVAGYIAKSRDLGAVIFCDVRDTKGIIQLNFNDECPRETFEKAKLLRTEYVVMAKGVVALRESPNNNIPTGKIEILVKEMKPGYESAEVLKLAKSIYDMLSSEFFAKVAIGIGTAADNVKDLARSFKEAQVALEVGKVFDTEKNIIAYENLGIGRLIYQLPTTLCEMFLNEVFKKGSIESIDRETLMTIQAFFENNLNVSETSRKLFVHRNTLVYRLEKINKLTGLDLREFDDAIVFKVALMVKKYLDAKPIKY